MGAGRPGAPPERRGRGQKGAAGVACGACPERGRLGQGLAPRRGWARAMGMAGVGLVMVGLVMEVGWMPWIGAAGPNGHRAACPLSGSGLCPLRGGCSPGRMGWSWARADPGFLGDGSGPLKRRRKIGAGRGSGARALMVILGWSGWVASRINLVPLQISKTLQGWVPLTRRIAERHRPVVVSDSGCAPCAVKLLLRCKVAHIRCAAGIRRIDE